MYITKEKINEINQVQLDIFKSFISVCEKLNLTYYVIHGSLLGAIKYNGFFPLDDDIDVAMPREDYNLLLEKGQKYFPNDIFLQSYLSENEYPLAFAKIRNSNTAFIQPILNNCNINKGIYIDLFPIDYYPENKITKKILSIKKKIYDTRIGSIFIYEKKRLNIRQRFSQLVSKILAPSWNNAIKQRASLFEKQPLSTSCIITGGKPSEQGIPYDWFGEGIFVTFEDMKVRIPTNYHEYLSRIYRDYNNYNPAAKYIQPDGTVEISADIIDVKKSYKLYNTK